MHSVAMPTASAAMMSRARSTKIWRPPVMTCADAPSSFRRAVRRVGSRLPGTSTVTPPPEVSTTMASSPAGRTRTWARPPPRTAFAIPVALPPDTVMSDVSAIPPKADPSARPGRSCDGHLGGSDGVDDGTGDHGRHEGSRRHGAAELLDHDDEFGQAEPRAAPLLGEVQAQPAQGDEIVPEGRKPFGLFQEQGASSPSCIALGEEIRGCLRKGTVVFGDGNRHG